MFPLLAIVGRPNVGKSTLFNAICGYRLAIVEANEGVTRDRIYSTSACFGKEFGLVDTGGIIPGEKGLAHEIGQQAQIAIEEADVIILVVDVRAGVLPLDEELIRLIRKTNKPTHIAVNKVDTPQLHHIIHMFHRFGFPIHPICAAQGTGVSDLLESALAPFTEQFKEPSTDQNPPKVIKTAIVGRPNVGKSTLMNQMLGKQRSVTSPVAGTTTDSVDSSFSWQDQQFILTDTAGIRRKNKEKELLDKLSFLRTRRAIERSDIAIFMIDATLGLTTQEKKIANMLFEFGRGCVVYLNKWDLVQGKRMEHAIKALELELPFLRGAPIVAGSALTGRNMDKILEAVTNVYASYTKRISTGELNRFLAEMLTCNPPPIVKGKRLRIYYMTQVSSAPPEFVAFVNNTAWATETWKRFLINKLATTFSFIGGPIRFYLRGKPSRNEI